MLSGSWSETYSPLYTGGSLQRTKEKGAAATLKFHGSGIEMFGNMGESYGQVNVFIDGKLDRKVDLHDSTLGTLKGQRTYWNYGLSDGKHTIKVVNVGNEKTGKRLFDVDAFVVTGSSEHPPSSSHDYTKQKEKHPDRPTERRAGEQWAMRQEGSTGVHAMQISIISPSHALIVDKVEHNPLTINGRPAWAALYNLNNHSLRPLRMQSNSFCAGGSFLSNGTLVNIGGNPIVEDHTSSADFGDLNGLQSIRLFDPCFREDVSECEMQEYHESIRMASPRWYNTVVRIPDGSAMIIGGAKKGGWTNNATVNNPTLEYFPPKSIHGSNGMPIPLQFLKDTLNSNLFPLAFVLPDGKIFMAANNDAIIYDWESNTETRLPSLPNGVRVTYPMAGTALLLPLLPENDYTPEVLICGGSSVDDKKPPWEISSQDPASSQCSRMALNDQGIQAGWKVEQMPEARIMPDAVLLPTGKVIIVNGGRTGISGYGNIKDQVGSSNADNPVLRPVLYDPYAAPNQRWSTNGMPVSDIARLYHSVATLTPKGEVMIAGSNPNLDRSSMKYGTEYRVEWLSPPYIDQDRPEITSSPKKLRFGEISGVRIKDRKYTSDTKGACFRRLFSHKNSLMPSLVLVVLMDLGYVTHATHTNSRLVELVTELEGDKLKIAGPPNGNIYPPGPGYLFVVRDGVPSKGVPVMIGEGHDPPSDKKALQK